MTRPWVAFVVVLGLLQLTRLAVMAVVVPPLVRQADAIAVDLPVCTRVNQLFEVREGEVRHVRFDAIASGNGAGRIDAVLVELRNAGQLVVERSSLTVSAGADCCEVLFAGDEVLRRRGNYRLDLVFRDGDPDLRLSTRIEPVAGEGGLTINQRPVRANLRLDAGLALSPPPGAPRIPLAMVMLCFGVVDAAILILVGRPYFRGESGPRRRGVIS